jgi:hypothetical protein
MEGIVKTIECPRIEPADNGVIICYDERITHPAKKGETYRNTEYTSRKEVFDFDADEDQDEEFEKAFTRFKELWQQASKDKKVKDKMKGY